MQLEDPPQLTFSVVVHDWVGRSISAQQPDRRFCIAAKMPQWSPDSHDSATVPSPSQVAPKLEEALKLYKDWGRGLLPTDFFCE